MINDYLVRWSTANHDNVATQLTHYKPNPSQFRIKRAILPSHPMSPKGKAAEQWGQETLTTRALLALLAASVVSSAFGDSMEPARVVSQPGIWNGSQTVLRMMRHRKYKRS